MLVAKPLPQLCAHLVSALSRLHVYKLVRISCLEAGMRGKKERRGAEKRKKPRAVVWHGKQEIPMARARVSRIGK
jgi:hypothetical protein